MTGRAPQPQPQVDDVDVVEVRLIGLPLAEHRAAAEHHDELMREFQLIRAQVDAEGRGNVPARLLDLIDEIRSKLGAFTAVTQAELDEALERGEERIDLAYRLPREARPMVHAFADMLEQADEFCRSGEGLLTLAAEGATLRYRQWYLGEFDRQLAGEAPTPWPG